MSDTALVFERYDLVARDGGRGFSVCYLFRRCRGKDWRAVVDETSSRGSGMPEYMAAAKTVKESAPASATDELIREAALMAQMDPHPNIVSLVGVVTRGTPKMLLISLAQHGSLLDYLRGASGKDMNPSRRATCRPATARREGVKLRSFPAVCRR